MFNQDTFSTRYLRVCRKATQSHTDIHTKGLFGIIKWPKRHIFGLWEEAEGVGDNPCMPKEVMRTPHRKAQLGFKSEPSSFQMRALTTTPLRIPIFNFFYLPNLSDKPKNARDEARTFKLKHNKPILWNTRREKRGQQDKEGPNTEHLNILWDK